MTPDPISAWTIAPSAALTIGCVLGLAAWALIALARTAIASLRRAEATLTGPTVLRHTHTGDHWEITGIRHIDGHNLIDLTHTNPRSGTHDTTVNRHGLETFYSAYLGARTGQDTP